VVLTRRRKDFLKQIIKIFEGTAAPVHYVTVAKALGVSKWTAYDILRELEKEGFLHVEYAVSHEEKNPGRSMVLFTPTKKAQQALEMEKGNADRMEEWYLVKEKLLGMVETIKKRGAKKVIDDLLEEMPGIEKPIIFSAYTIALLIVHIENLGSRSARMIRGLLKLAPKPELALSLFTGTVLGTMIKNMCGTFNGRIAAIVGQFQENLSKFDFDERKRLVTFLGEALERAR